MKYRPLKLPEAEYGRLYDLSRRTISHHEAKALGWTRTDPKPWSKLRAVWQHENGWTIQHCGHPTALTPWDLHDPDMIRHKTGALQKNIDHGTAWYSLAAAMDYVDLQEKRR